MAEDVSQAPSAAMLPDILIVWPTVVVTNSSNVTATDVAAAQLDVVLVEVFVVEVVVPPPPPAAVVVVVDTPVPGVWLAGNADVGAAE